ncbi:MULTISPECIES: tetratricopeptide repeat protein [Streptomyces]|uniref:Tetratricopeptide repeat protein n=1 Tax=Streptomyces lycii TaxID=2654337 RepID=A0ABQ7FLX5_9ACTN|nr:MULTISPECIES: tetratricopeptide repeat protein [Streptomyces]KAF4408217.1 tetratricopeptide repeat protein [Streptomyces lycii]PGH46826.1 transcriptional regulator [Streptomyces sp. Ru87]
MTEQPYFGRRLKELRKKRGLSQAILAGDKISTGYLSRLESGARQPTDRVITYLAEQLGVDRSAFDLPQSGDSLAQALSIANSTDNDQAVEGVITALEDADDADPLLRWQAFWTVARYWRFQGEHGKEQTCLEELTRIADELSLPELQCRALTQLARCLRSLGEVTRAIGVAERAYQLAKQEAKLSVPDIGQALLTLVSVEAEVGRLPDARTHVDELVGLVEDATDTLKAEALWSAATVRFRQGDHDGAREHLERALGILDSHSDLILWLRLRLAAASLYLQITPPLTDRSRDCLREAETALSLVGTPRLRQELLTLQAHLAFQEGRLEDARAAHDELLGGELLLTYRDRVRLSILDSRLMILEGRQEKGLQRLKELGEEARQAANIDLAAEIWRLLAETLESARWLQETTPTTAE